MDVWGLFSSCLKFFSEESETEIVSEAAFPRISSFRFLAFALPTPLVAVHLVFCLGVVGMSEGWGEGTGNKMCEGK